MDHDSVYYFSMFNDNFKEITNCKIVIGKQSGEPGCLIGSRTKTPQTKPPGHKPPDKNPLDKNPPCQNPPDKNPPDKTFFSEIL